MEPGKSLSSGSCDTVIGRLIALVMNCDKKAHSAVSNFDICYLGFFPFIQFVLWQLQMRKAKRLITEIKKNKGEENVVERADIDKGI